MRIKVAVVVENSAKKVLLIHEKTARDSEGGWNTIKGSVDEGEVLSKAALRECMEEAIVDVQIVGFLGIFIRHVDGSLVVQFNYLATTKDSGKVPDREEQVIRDEMIDEVRWFSRKQLEILEEEDMLNEGAYKLIQIYLKNRPYSLDLITET